MAEQTEIKERIPLWMYPHSLSLVDQLVQFDNCRSRSDAIEKAVKFYYGYRFSDEYMQFLSGSLTSILTSTINESEKHIVRLLFKLAVEVDMMTHIIAATTDVDEDTLQRLRGKCVNNVKQTRGAITFDDAVKFQKG